MPLFGNLRIPRELVDALRTHKLVIFAGAGVSMGAPTNFPDFNQLVTKIAKGCGLEKEKNESIDRYLGRLQANEVQVHKIAAEILSNKFSRPNLLHRDILALFTSADKVQIVTTNFDDQFERASRRVFTNHQTIRSHIAAALPMGDNFRGIVHLHGSIQTPEDMILTDKDFAQAYITEGWAKDFLLRLFRSYSVLFIGYSHDDLVMDYLQRALPREGFGNRFILTKEDSKSEEKWKRLNLQPIYYKLVNRRNSHYLLYQGVKKLGTFINRDILEWKKRLTILCEAPPPVDEETVDEVLESLQSIEISRVFCNRCKRSDWVLWLNEHKMIRELFNSLPLTDRDNNLCLWIAEFATSDAEIILELIRRNHYRINTEFWWALIRNIGLSNQMNYYSPEVPLLIKTLLKLAPPRLDSYSLSFVAEKCRVWGEINALLDVFFFLLNYQLRIKENRPWFSTSNLKNQITHYADIEFNTDNFILTRIWEQSLKKSDISVKLRVLKEIFIIFEKIYDDLLLCDNGQGQVDHFSYRRPAILEGEGEHAKYPEDALVDISCEILAELDAIDPVGFWKWIDLFITSRALLLRRIAIHAINNSLFLDPDKKLTFILDNLNPLLPIYKPEVLQLVKKQFTSFSLCNQDIVIQRILDYYEVDENGLRHDKWTDHFHFDWLSWLNEAGSSNILVIETLEKIRKQYPNIRKNKYFDSENGIRSLSSFNTSPITSVELREKNPSDIVDYLLSFKGEDFEGPSREGLRSIISEVVVEDFGWGERLCQELILREVWDTDLWASLFNAWQSTDITDQQKSIVLGFFEHPSILQKYPHEFTWIIQKWSQKQVNINHVWVKNAEKLADAVWRGYHPNPSLDINEGWVMQAINSVQGNIVQFWLKLVSCKLKNDFAKTNGLPEPFRKRFISIINDKGIKGRMGRTLLACQLVMLYHLDPDWTKEYLLPLFSEADSKRFSQAWEGFLTCGTLNEKLSKVIIPLISAATNRLGEITSDRLDNFVEFYTSIAVYFLENPVDEFLPPLFLNTDPKVYTRFSIEILQLLRKMETDSRDKLWNAWLKQFWTNRINSVPMYMSDLEISNMLDWLLFLGDLFPQGVELAVKMRPISSDSSILLYELNNNDAVINFPDATVDLLIYLCRCKFPYSLDYMSFVAKKVLTLTKWRNKELQVALLNFGIQDI